MQICQDQTKICQMASLCSLRPQAREAQTLATNHVHTKLPDRSQSPVEVRRIIRLKISVQRFHARRHVGMQAFEMHFQPEDRTQEILKYAEVCRMHRINCKMLQSQSWRSEDVQGILALTGTRAQIIFMIHLAASVRRVGRKIRINHLPGLGRVAKPTE